MPCLEHLRRQGVDVYIIDNQSEDRTVELAQPFLGAGVLNIETLPRDGTYQWGRILKRKEQLAIELDADWFMHVDADEIRLPPARSGSLADAFLATEQLGFNAVNFFEFTFVPTRQSPDHDHPNYLSTMRWYYAFLPRFPHRLTAWRKQRAAVDLVTSGGHEVKFPGLNMNPVSFPMRHYLFLSKAHAIQKYIEKIYDKSELAKGWHRARSGLKVSAIELQDESELRYYTPGDLLDPSNAMKKHPLFASAY